MSTWDASSPRPRASAPRARTFRPRLEALFGEARELARRRRRRRVLVTLAVLGAGLAGFVWLSSSDLPGLRTQGALSSASLPSSGHYSSLALVGDRLIIWGDAGADSDSQPQATSGRGRCAAARVDPRTLALGHLRAGPCADPALYGERVLLDTTIRPAADHGTVEALRVSVSTGRDDFAIGPVLAHLRGCTSCDPIFTYGDGGLWIFVPSPLGDGRGRSELLEVSAASGRLLRRWTLPALDRPSLAADRDGLWLAPSGFLGTPDLHPSAGELADYQSLYRVTPGGPARPIRRIGPTGARWLLASGNSLWAETGSPLRSHLLHLIGADARQGSDALYGLPATLLAGAGPTGQGVDAAVGVASLGVDAGGGLEVLSYDARTGRARVPTGVANAPRFARATAGVLLGGDFFFLEPPATATDPFVRPARITVQGRGVLYRLAIGHRPAPG